MLDDSDNPTADTAAPGPSCAWGDESPLPLTPPASEMTWLERYEALSAENAALSARFSKGTLSRRQFARLQGNIDQLAFLFAVYREAGFPDRNLPIDGSSPAPSS